METADSYFQTKFINSRREITISAVTISSFVQTLLSLDIKA